MRATGLTCMVVAAGLVMAAGVGRGEDAATRPAAATVVKMVPATLSDNVDPALGAISVTFDRPMQDGSWSWTGGGATFPKSAGKIHYDDALTTCTMPVKLEPGKVYVVGINSPSYRNFRALDGTPAALNVLVFATRDAAGQPTPIPEELKTRAKEVAAAGARAAPTVVKTSPEALANDVPAATTEVTVTFDQPMRDGGWSWTGGGKTFPEVTGKIRYDAAKMTCTLPVKLEPGTVYWIGINSPSHQNFQNAAGAGAKRYVILFATAGADGKATAIPERLLVQAKAINAVGVAK